MVLLGKLKEASEEDQKKHRKAISDLLGGEAQLRSKKELIELFIKENLPHIKDADAIPEAFAEFWDLQKEKALNALCEEEGIVKEKIYTIIESYLFTGRRPLRTDIVAALVKKPKIKERKRVTERVSDKVIEFIDTFDSDMGEV